MAEIDREKVIHSLECCLKFKETQWQGCAFCDYFSQGCNALQKDILALLKEQEPKVLTLEEVEERMNTNDAYDSIFYAEVRTLTKTSFGVFQLNFDSEDYYVAMLLGSSFPAWYRKESYGHKWRCWSAKPTIKQRQEVKWE